MCGTIFLERIIHMKEPAVGTMRVLKNCVLLLKAEKFEDTEDKYDAVLTEQGFLVKHLKTLDFKFSNLEQLKYCMLYPNNYEGIIFTTPRAVQGLRKALGSDILHPDWHHKQNYVVGEATHSLVLNEFCISCEGKESGNAKNLSTIILNHKEKIFKPFLFPCGNLKTDTLIRQLHKENIEVQPITIYETIASSTLEEDFDNVTSNYVHIPEYFAYFSPSGVYFTYVFLAKLNAIIHEIKFVAIGPTTETALKEKHLIVSSVARKPTPEDLLDAILH
ncbi:hypothetical protein FQA39_LY14034 [Lamprigera yunnana]|nr:hypothetical protein FQA39_LY14034 [Lamprigera yunnana]